MNPIIQDFLDNDYIDKEAAARLEEFDGMLKEAGWLDVVKDIGMNILKSVVPIAAGNLIGQSAYNYFGKRKIKEQNVKAGINMGASFNEMMQKSPTLMGRREDAAKRFNEIASLSPTVAQSPSVVSKIIERTLDGGLSERDMGGLLKIEVNSRSLKRTSIPSTFTGELSKGMLQSIGHSTASALSSGGMSAGHVGTASNMGTASSSGDPAMALNFHDSIKAYYAMRDRNVNFPSEIAGLNLNNQADQEKLYHYIEADNKRYVKLIQDAGLSNSDVKGYGEKTAGAILGRQYLLIKEAGVKIDIGRSLLGLGAASLFGLGMAAAEEAADYARTKSVNTRIKNSWDETTKKLKQMTTSGHRLALEVDYHKKDTMNKAREGFKVLADVAPSLAANPTIATSFVNQFMQGEGGIDITAIKTITDTQKNISTTQDYKSPFAGSPLASGFQSGFAGSGGSDIVKEYAKGLVKGE